MEMIGETDDMGRGALLTAPNDPLSLTVWHDLDWEASRLTLQFEAVNELDQALTSAGAGRLVIEVPLSR